MFCLLSATLALSCTTDAAPGDSPAGDPFAATPADGRAPEIGPAPDDYRPTAAGAPSTDIWLGRLARAADGTLTVSRLVNATDRDGYDNQPSFDPSGAALYYTSAVDSTQTEIFRLGVVGGTTAEAGTAAAARTAEEAGSSDSTPVQVTRTRGASEFSSTAIPCGDQLGSATACAKVSVAVPEPLS